MRDTKTHFYNLTKKYLILLPDKTVGWTDNILLWNKQIEDGNLRRVGRDVWGDVEVSTVFMGYEWFGCFFETMIFGGELDQYQERYKTYKEALAGHLHNLQLVRTYRLEGEVWSE